MTNVPLIELHLHLEGAAPPEFIRRLADEKRVKLEGVFDENGSYAYDNFDHFLQVYEQATTVLTGPEEFYRLTEVVLERSAEQGVLYTECFVSPDFCGGGDLVAWREYVAAMEEAAQVCEARHGIKMRGCVTAIRHEGPEKSKATALCAAETAGSFITGFGLAGAELMGEPSDFAYAFDLAREAELGLTAHAGEWGGASMVERTLNDLRPTRIGHGVMAIEDPRLVDRLAEDGIVLEVCPGSNVVLGVVPSWQDHPIERLRQAGVKITVSTDDPPFFHLTLGEDYERLAETFGWDDEVVREVNITAAEAAFCDDETRAVLMERLKK